jgi:hypothetical protein
VFDTMVVGVEIVGVAAAHVFAIGERGGVWVGNFAHDGYADAFHHTGGSSYCQVYIVTAVLSSRFFFSSSFTQLTDSTTHTSRNTRHENIDCFFSCFFF